MQLKQLFQDEDAVSPVIGVILMVAITVILAAVIGTFVLGLGDQVQSSAPNANFQFEYSGNFGSGGGTLTVAHNGGQDVERANIDIQVGGDLAWDGESPTSAQAWSSSVTNNFGTTVSTGDTVEIEQDSGDDTGDDVRVIWQSPNGDSSNTIGSSTVPN